MSKVSGNIKFPTGVLSIACIGTVFGRGSFMPRLGDEVQKKPEDSLALFIIKGPPFILLGPDV